MLIRLSGLMLLNLFLSVSPGVQAQYTYHCGGYLMHFLGTNGYVDAEDAYVDPTGLTLAAWVKCATSNPTNMGIIYRRFLVFQGASTTVQYGLIINNSGQFMFVGMIDTTAGKPPGTEFEPSVSGQLDSLSSGVVPQPGVFYHVAVTLDPNSYQCTFYVNGKVVASKTMKGPLHWANDGAGNFYDATIGAESVSYQSALRPYDFFNGYIDDAFESGFAVTKAQLDTIAAGNDLAEVSYLNYHFSEGSGSYTGSNLNISFNAVGYGNVGTLYGGYAWTNCTGPEPIAEAGPNQSITLPLDSVMLSGTASYEAGSGGPIKTYNWQQVSGPGNAGIESPSGSSTEVTGLVAGTYFFKLIIADSAGATDSAGIDITVTGCPSAPVISEDDDGILSSSAENGNQWFLNGKLIPDATSATYDPGETPGKYTVQVTVSGCTSPMSDAYCVNPDLPELSGEQVLCLDTATYDVDNSQDGVNYTWTLSDGGTISTMNNKAHVTWNQIGDYTLGVTASANGCTTAAGYLTVIISAPSSPLMTITTDTVLVLTSTTDSVQWFLNGIQIKMESTDEYEPGDDPGLYTAVNVDGTCISPHSNGICINPATPQIEPADSIDVSCLVEKLYEISEPEEGVSYIWALTDPGDSIVGYNEDSTEATISWKTYLGDRTVMVTPVIGGCYGTAGDYTASIKAPAKPTISFNQQDVALVADPDDDTYTYQWYQNGHPYGSDDAQLDLTLPGDCAKYQLVVTEDNCPSPISDPICVGPGSPGTIGGDSSLCPGQANYQIADPQVPVRYTWTVSGGSILGADSLSAVTVNWSSSGADTITLGSAAGGCLGDTSQKLIYVNPLPQTPTINFQGGVLFSNTVFGNQWFLNGNAIAGATDYQYSPADSGNYTVQVTNSGCVSEMSAPYFFHMIVTDSSTLSIFPNPSSSLLTVNNTSAGKFTIQLFDSFGRGLATMTHVSGTSQINISSYATGVYTILITNESTMRQTRKQVLKL